MTKLKRLGMAALILFVAYLFLSGWLNRPVFARETARWQEPEDGYPAWDTYQAALMRQR